MVLVTALGSSLSSSTKDILRTCYEFAFCPYFNVIKVEFNLDNVETRAKNQIITLT
jgi:hypothetical protein